MERVDRLYLAHPENGSRMMVRVLARSGINVNRKRVQRLVNLMGIRSLAPQRKTTVANKEHFKYPYLLGGLLIDRPNMVWCSDIERHEALLNREGVQDLLQQPVAAGW